MNVIVLTAAFLSSPSFASAITNDQVRWEVSLGFALMNMAPDFDCDPKPSIIANARIGLLSSREAEARATGVKSIWLYLLLKKQTEGSDTFDGTSLMMRKSLGEYLEAVKAGLERNLQDQDPKIRGMAAASLLTLDPRHNRAGAVFLEYVEKLGDLDTKEMEGSELAFTISFAPPEFAVPTLKRMLACEKKEIRRAALQAILLIGDEAKEFSPAIAKMLIKKDPAIFGDLPVMRIGFPAKENLALLCLGILDGGAAKAIPVLLEAIKTGSALESEGYYLLGKISGESKEVADCLRQVMKGSSEETKFYAASGLVYAHPDDADALKSVMEGLESKDLSTQKLAMKACARIGARAKPAVPTLIKMFKGTKDEKRLKDIADIFSLIGPNAAEAIPYLKRELEAQHSDGTISENLAGAMAKIGGKGQAELAQLLEEKDRYGAHEASKALGDLTEEPTSKTVKALATYHFSNDWAVGDCFTLISIGKLRAQAKEAIPMLKEAAKSKKKYRTDLHGMNEAIEPYAHWALRRVSGELPKPNPLINKLATIIVGRTQPFQSVFSHAD